MTATQTRGRPGLLEMIRAHLLREESYWSRLREHLTRMEVATASGDLATLESFAHEQAALSEVGAAMHDERGQLRQRLAETLGPSVTSLNDAFAVLAPDSSLLALRGRVRAVATEAQRAHRANFHLVQLFLHFMQRFLSDLTRGTNSDCYGPGGTMRPPSYGPLVQARG